MLSTDLKVYRALANGRISTNQVNSGVVQNVFAHVTSAQRAAGLTDYVKTWWKVADAAGGVLLDPEAYQDAPTKSAGDDDYVVMWLSSARTANDQATLAAEAAAAPKFGSAVLAADVTAGAMSVDVAVKHANMLPGAADEIFRDGEPVRICSNSTAIATDGVEETLTLAGDAVLVSGLTVRLTFTSAVANSFTANGVTRCSSLIKTADVQPSVSGFTVTTAGDGAYDVASYPLILDNIGTPEEDLSFDFTDATNFALTGDTLGAMGAGNKGADFSPNNPDFSRPYLTLEAGGFSGTWAAGDKITCSVHPAAIPIGQKRVVKAGAASLANNRVAQVFGGEAN